MTPRLKKIFFGTSDQKIGKLLKDKRLYGKLNKVEKTTWQRFKSVHANICKIRRNGNCSETVSNYCKPIGCRFSFGLFSWKN